VRLLAEPLQDLLLNYGGHENALGFSMDRRNWEPYLARLEIEIGFISLQEVSPTDADTIDAELPRRYMTPDIFKIVDRFEPYGTGNKPLVFAARELKVLDSRFLGKTRPKHIKLTVDAGEYKWPAILWDGINKPAADINAGDTVDMLYTFNRNWYKGIEYPQIIIRDICKSAVI
jgi:single-stranded-DNA-specific exonuclease